MTAFATADDGTSIAYDVVGAGPPLLLIHGFAASRATTWRGTGWYRDMAARGYRVIAMDCRGHGESGKPHDALAYDEGRMGADAICVLDACGVATADVAGYSMGAFLTIRLMVDAPARLRRAVLGGVGGRYFDFWESRAAFIADALRAADPALIADPLGREFRRFAAAGNNDLAALAACMMRPRRVFGPGDLARLLHPVLVACGSRDDMSGRPEDLARHFAHGRAFTIPGRNHLQAVSDKTFKDAVANFLGQ